MAADVLLVGSTGADLPVVAAAIHDGHYVRPAVAELLALGPADRRREEDPFTGTWAAVAPLHFIALRSRFEFDLNRPRSAAVYRKPEDAWGLDVWRETPPDSVVEESLSCYDRCYQTMRKELGRVEARHGRFVLLDIHSYNHRRAGPAAEPAAPADNPDINIGTGSMNRDLWGPVVDTLITELSRLEIGGRRLEVRENVKFRGGQLARWVHQEFPETGCAPAIEFKKVFMDEWTGEPDRHALLAIERTVAAALDPVCEALERIRNSEER